ncbi:MAG: NAD-dependent epimerase/dehydratase family protein [Longimicrobiales bacterium]
MNILVTGGAGYLGSVIVPKLLVRRHRVRVLDVGYFGIGHLRACQPPPEILRDDVRRVSTDPAFCAALLDGMDCVIHLAAVSNDPSAELQPELTAEVNLAATQALAEAARARGCRFLFSSSCSVYGSAAGLLDEDGRTQPLTVYALSKIKAEEYLESMACADWRPVILRNGTLFGYSPRMRFDLVANIFSLHSTLYDEIRIFGSGQHWRPFLHVQDCARAFLHFAELAAPSYLRYNIAHENLRVIDLAQRFAQLNPRLRVEYTALPEPDARDYRVSTTRAAADGFVPRVDVMTGAEEMCAAIVSGVIPDPESVFYRNAKWLSELTQIGGKNHRDLVGLMETMARIPGAGR